MTDFMQLLSFDPVLALGAIAVLGMAIAIICIFWVFSGGGVGKP